eukprot:3032405-Prymnesium_polylepis.1
MQRVLTSRAASAFGGALEHQDRGIRRRHSNMIARVEVVLPPLSNEVARVDAAIRHPMLRDRLM